MSTCVGCGQSSQCGMVAADAPDPCWCAQWPPLPAEQLHAAAASGKAGCYCADCLCALVDVKAAGRRENEGEAAG